MDGLKYRKRISTSIDRGLYRALYNYSIDSRIPLSRLLDEAITLLLDQYGLPYTADAPYKKEKITSG